MAICTCTSMGSWEFSVYWTNNHIDFFLFILLAHLSLLIKTVYIDEAHDQTHQVDDQLVSSPYGILQQHDPIYTLPCPRSFDLQPSHARVHRSPTLPSHP